jgi:hypothetical protein
LATVYAPRPIGQFSAAQTLVVLPANGTRNGESARALLMASPARAVTLRGRQASTDGAATSLVRPRVWSADIGSGAVICGGQRSAVA